MRTLPSAYLKQHEEDRLLRGHPWVYNNEIGRIAGTTEAGGEMHVFSSQKRFMGTGIYSPSSKIRIRLYSSSDVALSEDLLRARIHKAIAIRRDFRNFEADCARIIFAEADGLPGLIVDRFAGSDPAGVRGSWLSVQFLAFGMDSRRDLILKLLSEALAPDGIMERSDAPVRKLEGLEPRTGVLLGSVPKTITITENGLTFRVHIGEGQKTGWFMDQKENRASVAVHARGQNVLDMFCNEGGFSLAAAAAGAQNVVAVDASFDAVSAVAANAKANGLEGKISTHAANAFEFLRDEKASKGPYGLIILDPPAFAKNRAAVDGALRGYREINVRALKLLGDGGTLATFSCSFWISRDRFLETLEASAADAGMALRYIQELCQAPDHPIVSGYPESRYLKGFIVKAEKR